MRRFHRLQRDRLRPDGQHRHHGHRNGHRPPTTSTDTGACVDDPPAVAVTNGTPWTLAALQFAPCDAPGELETFPFPGMLEPDASFDVPLPAAGCYTLGIVEPSGCELFEPLMTGELAACGVFPLELSEDDFACPGGAR